MKRSLFSVVATSVFLGVSMLAVAAPAGAHGGRWHGSSGHGVTVVKPGESIQAAIDAAAAGSTIFVKRGQYAENVAITTDGITLKGRGAKLVPPASSTPNACSGDQPATDGICAVGQVDFPADGPPNVTDPISDVRISGFDVKGFSGSGIFFLGAENPVVTHNRVKDNGEYGIARFVSTGGKIIGNAASGSEEAGIYVGDSPEANVLVAGNRVFDNELFGFFLRDAAHGHVVGNHSSGNCVGAIVLNTGANVAGDWRFTANKIHDNDRFCPGNDEEGTPPLSGIGVLIANGADNRVFGNVIRNNNPSGDVPFSGGVVVVNAGTPGANPPSGNAVFGNVILGNQPDLFWDGSGEGNVFRRNLCRTSVPDGLCSGDGGHGHSGHGDDGHGHDGHGNGGRESHSHNSDDRGHGRHHNGHGGRWHR
jgi:parallel beta-helix repeat protein